MRLREVSERFRTALALGKSTSLQIRPRNRFLHSVSFLIWIAFLSNILLHHMPTISEKLMRSQVFVGFWSSQHLFWMGLVATVISVSLIAITFIDLLTYSPEAFTMPGELLYGKPIDVLNCGDSGIRIVDALMRDSKLAILLRQIAGRPPAQHHINLTVHALTESAWTVIRGSGLKAYVMFRVLFLQAQLLVTYALAIHYLNECHQTALLIRENGAAPTCIIDQLYFVASTFSTIGYGDITPAIEGDHLSQLVFTCIGISSVVFFYVSFATFIQGFQSIRVNVATSMREYVERVVTTAKRREQYLSL